MFDHKHYTYRVTWSGDDEEYIALCAELPSLPFLAGDSTDALEGMVELVGDVVKDIVVEGEVVPIPLMTDSAEPTRYLRLHCRPLLS